MKDAIRRFARGLWRSLTDGPSLGDRLDRLAVRPTPIANAAPVLIKDDAPDGGTAAALTMVLNAYHRPITLAQIHAELGPIEDGHRDALQIVRAVELRGLGARGVSLEDPDAMRFLRPADILHVDDHRFVVVEAVVAGGVHVLDAAAGRRFIGTVGGDRPQIALLFAATPVGVAARGRAHAIPRAVARRARST